MKIIHITPTLGCGGAEVLIGNIAIEQAKRGHSVVIVIMEALHPTYPNYFLKNELEERVQIIRINAKISFSFIRSSIEVQSSEFENLIQSFLPDVIHSHLFKAELLSRYKIYKGIKYITHCHNNMEQFDIFSDKPLKRKILDLLEVKWLMRKYNECDNTFITISKDTQNYFNNILPPGLRKNITLLYNAINTGYYYSNQQKAETIQLITVGNLSPNKGHDFLIEAVNKLHTEGYCVTLDILGYGDLKEKLQAKIDTLNLSSYIFLRGNVSNVNEFLSKSHIYVHAALKEGFGLVLLEAMASDLPVITTNGGGNKDLIEEGENGFLVENRDLEAFTEKIKLLIDSEVLRKKIAQNAKAFSKQFDVKQYVDRLHEIYLNKHQ